MNLNDLLIAKSIDPRQVLVFRHRPDQPALNRVFPWLAAERPELFNAYQQTQSEKVEKVMTGAGYVASFIGHEPGRALFVGLYNIGATKRMTPDEYWSVPAYVELKKEFGLRGFTGDRPSLLWFDLKLNDFYSHWKGKLIVSWPPPERSWWRRSHRNDIPVLAILEESALDKPLQDWKDIVLDWKELQVLPKRVKAALDHWRCIYYIFDSSDGKGYVGSAYGSNNLLGRWMNYAASGHGGNSQLRKRDPQHFRFSVLERLSPDTDANAVILLEETWKRRLHTHAPDGLNDN